MEIFQNHIKYVLYKIGLKKIYYHIIIDDLTVLLEKCKVWQWVKHLKVKRRPASQPANMAVPTNFTIKINVQKNYFLCL